MSQYKHFGNTPVGGYENNRIYVKQKKKGILLFKVCYFSPTQERWNG